MNRRASGLALTLALGLVRFDGLASCSSCSRVEPRGPFLSVLRQEGATVLVRAIPSTSERSASMALALGGLPAEALTGLRERLEESTEAALRRAAPTLFDLGLAEEDGAKDPLRQTLPDVPAMTAAANVLGAPWIGSGLSVMVGASCEAGAFRCVRLFDPTLDRRDAVVRRGRALAWTLSNAAPLHVRASSRTHLLQSLRDAQARPSSTIALVFAASRGALDEAELELLREQSRRTLAHLPPDAPLRPWLDALGAAPATWELPIALDTDELLVIPRLSALARLQDFHAEIDSAVNRL
jgi:hypothetical protein